MTHGEPDAFDGLSYIENLMEFAQRAAESWGEDDVHPEYKRGYVKAVTEVRDLVNRAIVSAVNNDPYIHTLVVLVEDKTEYEALAEQRDIARAAARRKLTPGFRVTSDG